MTATQTQQQALTGSHGHVAGASQSAMVEVSRKAGVSPFKQFADIWPLRRSAGQIAVGEYYEFQLWRPDLTWAQKKEYLGDRGSFALNMRLAPPAVSHMRNFLGDKLAFTTYAAGLGFATTRTQAAFHPTRGFGQLRTLRSAAEVESFLRQEARFPLFGKPIRGQQAKGSLRVDGIEGDEAILPKGRIALARLAAEIAGNDEEGYLFQDAVEVAPEIRAMTGTDTVSTLRVVTVNRTGTPEVLYTCWKLPSPQAVSDNFWQEGSLIAGVDAQGVIGKVRLGTGLQTTWVERHPVTGAALAGQALPHHRAAVDLALGLHATVPVNGVLGWDIALVPGGACLIECNENAGHMLYQLAHDRGALNPDFTAIFAGVEARNAAILSGRGKAFKAYLKDQARV